ncbi:MAG: toxin-antitoxin system YwqK family antitoxin [Gemmatimonadetes bacterium]|nr:toxin-antitoxin system YwqK family antitoxin [Gemmatimonadota bacterium]NNF15054.1 toxin-antitoxin system YwqK family antitoxin [Gemmatimonadota bacterium]
MHVRSGPPTLRTLLALFALLSVAAACERTEERPVDDLVRQGNVFLDPETKEPYSGLAIATFDDQPGVLAKRLTLREGTYDGPYEAFFENRRLSSREIYRDGVRDGRYEWYFENGQLFEEGTYVQGTLEGPYRAYWENGDLYEEGSYRSGRFDGPRRWYIDGRLVELVTYRDGTIDGLYERYLEDGTLDLKGMLREGTPCGMWIEGDQAIPYPDCSTRIVD